MKSNTLLDSQKKLDAIKNELEKIAFEYRALKKKKQVQKIKKELGM